MYFTNKSHGQIERILLALRFVTKEDDFGRYASMTITDEEYIRMRRIINCNGDKHSVVNFVDRYLGYDEYGELSRDKLR